MRRFLVLFSVMVCFMSSLCFAKEIRVGLESLYRKKSEIKIEDKEFLLSVGDGERYPMHLGTSVVRPINKQYFDTGISCSSYNRAYDKMQRYLGSNCIPVLKNDGWGVYITLSTKEDTSDMKLVSTGGNAVVFSVNGVNKYLVDGSASARVCSEEEAIDLGERSYRGDIAFYREDSGLTAINILSAEEYLYGVIGSEISSEWNIEAQKAQAVAARTFANKCMSLSKHGVYDLCDSSHCQSYLGTLKESKNGKKAVDETSGECMYYNNELISAVYFSSSGGSTLSGEQVWRSATPYLQSVSDTYEKECKYWERSFTLNELTSVAASNKFGIGDVYALEASYYPNGRVSCLYFVGTQGKKEVNYDSIRSIFACTGQSLYSTNFTLSVNEGGTYILKGKGYGHGVGMSQYGAKGMAESGFSYTDILRHYYSGVVIE